MLYHVIITFNLGFSVKKRPNLHSFSFAISQKLFSPEGFALQPVWGGLIAPFPTVHSQNLDIFVPEDKNAESLLYVCVCVYIQHVALKITLTGQPATALWQRRPAPSAVWPACA